MLTLILALALTEPGAIAPRPARDLRVAASQPTPLEAASRPSDAELEAARALGRLAAGEPSIEDVQTAAARQAGFGAASAESWRWRARAAAWLPKLGAEFRHDERSYRVTGLTGSGEVDYLRSSPGDVIGIRATWDLDALIFNPLEAQAVTAAAGLLRRRDELVERATRLFFRRQRLRLVLLLAAPAGAQPRAEAELDLAEVTSELDALTGGLFAERAP